MEKITVINGAVPVYRFTIPEGDSFGMYSGISAEFLVDAENYRKFARARAYGCYLSEDFEDLNNMVLMDFNGNKKDKNGPYLLSNVFGSQTNLDEISGGAGAYKWFRMEFPLTGMNHPSYNQENFPDKETSGMLYFALGLGTGDSEIGFTYYVRNVSLHSKDGEKTISPDGSGFDKPAFAGYFDGIQELSRANVKSVDIVDASEDTGYYRVKEIYPWLYSIYDPLSVYCYLVVGEDRALLFDTAYGIGNLPEAIRKITDKPLTVVIGHGHVDHANGAYQFDEALLDEDDFALCKEQTSAEVRREIVAGMGSGLPEGFDPDSYVKAGAGNIKKLDIGRVFDLGGLHLEVIAMEGHTAGSAGLLVKEKRILLDSDSANPYLYLFLDESLPVSRYIAMLERVEQLDFTDFYWGHSDTPLPKSYFRKFEDVARNATVEKADPYGDYAYIYQEDDVRIMFNKKTLR